MHFWPLKIFLAHQKIVCSAASEHTVLSFEAVMSWSFAHHVLKGLQVLTEIRDTHLIDTYDS